MSRNILNYENFKELVIENFIDYMPAEYRGMNVETRTINKVNEKKDALVLVEPNPENSKARIVPNIYIDDMYKAFEKSRDINKIMEMAAAAMTNAFKKVEDKKVDMIDFDKMRENIVFQLINTEQNRDMLSKMPHREFHDLSIIYRLMVKADEDGIASSVINNEMADKFGLTEKQMFKLAAENTKRLLPPMIKSMDEVMRDMLAKDGMPDEIADMMIGDIPPESQLYVISNYRGINGAASMLYEDGLHQLAEKLDSDLYIMPSSVHEVIAVSVKMGEPDKLAEMVADVNMSQVDLKERLSNQVYHYDKDLRKISMATDTPNKRLDGIVNIDNSFVRKAGRSI